MVGKVVRFGEESLKLGGHFYLPLKAAIGGRLTDRELMDGKFL